MEFERYDPEQTPYANFCAIRAMVHQAWRFFDHHPVARDAAHGKGLRSRVKRKRAMRKAMRRTFAFDVTYYRNLDGTYEIVEASTPGL